MSELQNKTVTMELNNLQLETIKYLFGHNDWEMKIIEQSAVDNYFTYFVPVFKYCYSDSRNL